MNCICCYCCCCCCCCVFSTVGSSIGSRQGQGEEAEAGCGGRRGTGRRRREPCQAQVDCAARDIHGAADLLQGDHRGVHPHRREEAHRGAQQLDNRSGLASTLAPFHHLHLRRRLLLILVVFRLPPTLLINRLSKHLKKRYD